MFAYKARLWNLLEHASVSLMNLGDVLATLGERLARHCGRKSNEALLAYRQRHNV